jgi:hypothetical protein
MRTFDAPHGLSEYPMPNILDEDPESPSEAWEQLRERQDTEGGLPPWFAAHQRATADRFRTMHDAIKALHDMMNALGQRHQARGDQTIFDPDAEVSGEVEDTHDAVQSLRDLNRANRFQHHRKTRDVASVKIRSLTDMNKFLKGYYPRPWSPRPNAR